MASVFSKPKMPEPIIVAAPPVSKDDTAIKEAAEREAERIRKRRGMKSTIMTGPQGLTTQPTVLKEELGG